MAQVYNATQQPVVIDPEGRVLGGDETGEADITDPGVAAAIAADRLVIIDKVEVVPGRTKTAAAADNVNTSKEGV